MRATTSHSKPNNILTVSKQL